MNCTITANTQYVAGGVAVDWENHILLHFRRYTHEGATDIGEVEGIDSRMV